MARRKKNELDIDESVEKVVNHIGLKTTLICLLCLIVGFGGGFLTYKLMSKNDYFKIIGEKEITLNLNDSYTEQGAKALSLGKDVSGDIVVSGEVDTTKEGMYVVTYTCTNWKFKKVKRVRTIYVVDPTKVVE